MAHDARDDADYFFPVLRSYTPRSLPTCPPSASDEAALEFSRALACEADTGPVALPGSIRFRALEGVCSGEVEE